MSLCFTGPRGAVEQRWIVYAMLRDNVQHYLEGGHPSPEFAGIHEAGGALGAAPVKLNARRLRHELEQARDGLLDKSIGDLAISAHTQSVLEMAWPPPETEDTMLVSGSIGAVPWLDAGVASLDQAFGHLVRALLEITLEAEEDDVVEVRDL